MNLKMYLVENKITQREFAKKLNITETHLSKITLGYYKPGKSLAHLIEIMTNGQVKFDKKKDK